MRLAFICGGRKWAKDPDEEKQLNIVNSLNRINSTLKNHTWSTKIIQPLNEVKYKEFIQDNYSTQEVDELLFYYVGHGDGGIVLDFEIFFENQGISIKKLIHITKQAFKNSPKKIVLVIDSCYSGEALKDIADFNNVEILTATNANAKTIEKKIDGEFVSIFSHYFCKAFECSYENTHTVTLELIGENIELDTKPFYSRANSLEYGKTVIGYTHKLNQLKNKIKTYYQQKTQNEQEQVTIFQQDILRFYPRTKEKIYNHIRASKTIDALFRVLLNDEKGGYLYCILKFLKIEDEYPNHEIEK